MEIPRQVKDRIGEAVASLILFVSEPGRTRVMYRLTYGSDGYTLVLRDKEDPMFSITKDVNLSCFSVEEIPELIFEAIQLARR